MSQFFSIIKELLASAILLLLVAPLVNAKGIGLNATRIIYPEGDRSIGVVIHNDEPKTSYLVQTFITSNENKITFDIAPPIFRVNSQSKHEIKIYEKANNLPKDRESLFYFHAKMIPGQGAPTKGDGINIGFDHVIKIFYRPKKLNIPVEEAQQKLKFSVIGSQLEVTNDSPYYINFASVSVNGKKLDVSLRNKNAMIIPFGSLKYPLPAASLQGEVRWQVINDLGGFNDFISTFK